MKSKEASRGIEDIGTIALDGANDVLSALGNSAAILLKQGKNKVMNMECGCEDYIRERPLKSILIAAAVGLVLGRFWMRR